MPYKTSKCSRGLRKLLNSDTNLVCFGNIPCFSRHDVNTYQNYIRPVPCCCKIYWCRLWRMGWDWHRFLCTKCLQKKNHRLASRLARNAMACGGNYFSYACRHGCQTLNKWWVCNCVVFCVVYRNNVAYSSVSVSIHWGLSFLISSVAFLAENALSGVSRFAMSSEKCSLRSL